MNLLSSKNSWVIAPIIFFIGIVSFVFCWLTIDPRTLIISFDNDGHSLVEILTLPVFAMIIPLAWLCCPVSGSMKKKIFFSSIFSLLGFMALVRQLDWHKQWFSMIWPEITFKGTVFKMRFLTSPDIPFMPKLFVIAFFILFGFAVLTPLVFYFKKLFKGFFKMHPVAWSVAFFGISGVMSQACDGLTKTCRKANLFTPELLDASSGAVTALFTALEEGGELLMAIFAVLAIIQSHVIFAPDTPAEKHKEI